MQQAITALLPLLRLYPWAIPGLILLNGLSSFFEGFGISLFIPLLQSFDSSPTTASDPISQWLNQLFVDIPSTHRFLIITLCVFSSIVLKNGLFYANAVLSSWLNTRICHQLRSNLFHQLLSVSYRFLETNESGQLVNVLATETWQTSQALSVFISLITCICTISVLIGFLLFISWKLTLFVGIAVLVISLIIQTVTRQVKHLGKQAVQANTLLSNRTWEGMGGMRVIRLFGRESYEQQRYDRASGGVRDTFFQLETLAGTVGPLSEILSAGLILIVLVMALQQSQATLPTLLTFLFILYRLQPQVKQLDMARVGLAGLTGSVQAVTSLLDPSDKPYLYSGTTPYWGLQHAVSFAAVEFRYNDDRPAVQDISIQFLKGKTTALVGPSGAGKSTIIGLLCRLYDPTAGEIYVDDRPLRQLSLDDWRNHMAIVSQDTYLFSASVRDNIAYGCLDVSDADIEKAAKLANAHEFITDLPLGYDTAVGDRGVRLSGGQRQRIALARAIVRDPEILILDEATNALDSISETLIQEALDTLSQNRTVIIIAHRLSTIEQADQIIVMQEGQVVEQGNLQQLLDHNGLFAQLYRLQHRSPSL